MTDDSVIEWLLAGDPVIRWQTMRDLLDEPAATWQTEQTRTVETGWVADLLGHQGRDGEWPKGRWTASTWTLLLLVACGLPEDHPSGRASVERLLDRFMPPGADVDCAFMLKRVDLCHLGFWLGLGARFLNGDSRLPQLAEAVLAAQFDDGAGTARCAITRGRTTARFTRRSTCSRTCGSLPGADQCLSERSATPRRARSSSCSRTAFIARTRPARSSRSASRI